MAVEVSRCFSMVLNKKTMKIEKAIIEERLAMFRLDSDKSIAGTIADEQV